MAVQFKLHSHTNNFGARKWCKFLGSLILIFEGNGFDFDNLINIIINNKIYRLMLIQQETKLDHIWITYFYDSMIQICSIFLMIEL